MTKNQSPPSLPAHVSCATVLTPRLHRYWSVIMKLPPATLPARPLLLDGNGADHPARLLIKGIVPTRSVAQTVRM